MTCINCGNEVRENKYCNKCGTFAGAAPTEPQQAPVAPPPPPMYQAPPMQQQTPPVYQAPPMPQSDIFQVPRVKDYVIMMLIAMIPIAGFIMMIIWAVGGGDIPLWKSNYARACWIIGAIVFALIIVLSIIVAVIVAAVVGTATGSFFNALYY